MDEGIEVAMDTGRSVMVITCTVEFEAFLDEASNAGWVLCNIIPRDYAQTVH